MFDSSTNFKTFKFTLLLIKFSNVHLQLEIINF